MMVLEAKPLARKIEASLKDRINSLDRLGKKPKLVAVSYKPDPSAKAYLESQARVARRLGITYEIVEPGQEDEASYIETIQKINDDPSIDGAIIMTPLPEGVSEERVRIALSPVKDVEGVTPQNLGALFYENEFMPPCTAEATLRLAEFYGIDFTGKNTVVVGRSVVVGKPLAMMLLKKSRSATVTVCHTRTKDLTSFTHNADILIVAAGKPGLIKREHVKEGAVVLDVGINAVDGRIVGDVDLESVKDLVSAISPVPGGVGTITTFVLMEHVVKSAEMVIRS